MSNAVVERLQPKTDLSVRTALSRLEAAMAGMEERTSVKLSALDDGHRALGAAVSEVAETVTQTPIVAGWEVAQGVATMVMHALGAHR